MRSIMLTGIACAVSVSTYAQVVDKGVIQNFNAGIVAKVFEVTKNVHLNGAQQYTLAGFYNNLDSAIKTAIVQGRPAREIDSMSSGSQQILYKILSKEQMQEYVMNKGQAFAALASESELQFVTEEYQPDSTLLRNLKTILSGKYSYIFQKYLFSGTNQEWAKEEVKRMVKWYDLYTLYPALYSSRYINDYLSKLLSVKEIPDNTLQAIKRSFFTSLKTNKYADWSKTLADITRHYLPDTAIYSNLQHDKLDNEAKASSETERVGLSRWHHVTQSAYDKIYPLVLQKNYNNSLLQYTYGANNQHLSDSLIKKNITLYDSLINRELLLDGSMLNFSQFELALKYRENLRLRPQLTDSLLYHALYVSKWIDRVHETQPFAYVDVSAYESRVLTGLLTEEEYTQLLAIKNRNTAQSNAISDWQEIEQRNLTQGLDKEQSIAQLTGFYTAKYSVQNRYAHDKYTQSEVLRTMDKNKPQALAALDQARWSAANSKPKPVFTPQW